jgi:membrane protein DedA with SNARE-associated domain
MHHFWDTTKALLVQWGPLGALIIAAIDAAGIPNPGITDFVLVAAGIASPATAMICATAAVLGSLFGGLVFFEITRRGGERYLLRYTSSGRGLKFRAWFLRFGLVTVFITALLPLPFLPFKFFAACAGAMGENRIKFLLVLAAARIPRYFGLVYLGATLGEQSAPWIKAHLTQMAVFALILFFALYALVRFTDRRRGIEARP